MKKIGTMIVMTAFLLSSCSKEVITGSGTVGTRTLSVPAFSSVETHYDINAIVSYGAGQELTVTGYENILNILDFSVENGVLKLKYNTLYNTVRNGKINVSIRVPAMSTATIHGSGNLQVNDFTSGDALTVRIHGSGNVGVNNSVFQTAVIDMHGSGDINAKGLLAKQVQANVYGSGKTRISVSDKLTARIYGSGDILYWGNPQLEDFRSGTGRALRQ